MTSKILLIFGAETDKHAQESELKTTFMPQKNRTPNLFLYFLLCSRQDNVRIKHIVKTGQKQSE